MGKSGLEAAPIAVSTAIALSGCAGYGEKRFGGSAKQQDHKPHEEEHDIHTHVEMAAGVTAYRTHEGTKEGLGVLEQGASISTPFNNNSETKLDGVLGVEALEQRAALGPGGKPESEMKPFDRDEAALRAGVRVSRRSIFNLLDAELEVGLGFLGQDWGKDRGKSGERMLLSSKTLVKLELPLGNDHKAIPFVEETLWNARGNEPKTDQTWSSTKLGFGTEGKHLPKGIRIDVYGGADVRDEGTGKERVLERSVSVLGGVRVSIDELMKLGNASLFFEFGSLISGASSAGDDKTRFDSGNTIFAGAAVGF